ncbi:MULTISPECIES: Mor transcription activator family protein [unclassified Pseudoalteromonas]|uniref:Mor transcription activator family protein n=1 Tax=unclassified Pseudoalteromonas TaxID=194690 RepID=UPI001F293F92|nr:MULTISPECIES: Mor transcription activator family protein [unclassified Pseudoalteromonas]MCF2829803.1 transcriptional regulator [Pseudoalteromonas sp. OF5H-5]MCF2834497.1 transcriptional regulator [Pseudoalteromonas sp. DL2-H6]MCF2927769.1 transcriptional regulator [Pseudoalteromonas sp. DL2-H1]
MSNLDHVELGKASERAEGMLFTILELVAEGTKKALGEDEAAKLGLDVVDTVRTTFGGEYVYVCKGRKLDAMLKSNQIWAEFRGNNHRELAKKFGCSVQWVYTVIRTKNLILYGDIQGDLFASIEEPGIRGAK